jgi:MarR family 2-MHQ and catechol resistance regulon transcriptional repressor
MAKNSRAPVHCWLVWGKAFHAAAKYLYAGLEETGIDDTDFRILEALLNKGPLPVNTIGPKVYLTLRQARSVWPSTACWIRSFG